MNGRYSWIPVYTAIADALLAFRRQRAELIARLQHEFAAAGLKIPKVDYDGQIRDIDPFTVFGFFNRRTTTVNRAAILQAVARAVGVSVPDPADYDGVPLLNNLKSCFTGFTDHPKRHDDDVDRLWEVYDLALRYADGEASCRPQLEAAWDQAVGQFCVKWNLSLALFWIRPEKFVGLDANNRRFITGRIRGAGVPSLSNNNVPSGADYLAIADAVLVAAGRDDATVKSIPELSYQAWRRAAEADSDLYWLTANPERWSLKEMPVGAVETYTVQNEKGHKRQNPNAFKSIRVGDRIVGYQAVEPRSILSVLTCTRASDGETIAFRKMRDLVNPISRQKVLEDDVLAGSEPIKRSEGSLFRLKESEAAALKELIEDENDDWQNEEDLTMTGIPANGKNIWFWSPGYQGSEWEDCCRDGFMCLGWNKIGKLDQYATREDVEAAIRQTLPENAPRPKNGSLACWEFLHEMKKGDIVIAKQGMTRLLGVGVIVGDYDWDESRSDYKNVRACRWIGTESKPSPVRLPMKTLTNMNPWPEISQKVMAALNFNPETLTCEVAEAELDEEDEGAQPYGRDAFLSEVFMDGDEYDRLVRLVDIKKNVILTGAPGVGKTFAAKRLAWSRVGSKDSRRIGFVQFHQSYTYEDFVGGYKPASNGGFEYRKGVFAAFCERAAKDPNGGDYYFIIDEINRGNLSKIFGELLMLIEADKRGDSVILPACDDELVVPRNVRIIGMMNTADRSLAMMDYALRRRFSFYPIKPGFEVPGFKELVVDSRMRSLVDAVVKLNKVIADDPSLGEGFVIGHSYFIDPPKTEDLRRKRPEDVVEFDLAPTLREYWFDEPERAEKAIEDLRAAIRL